MKSGFERKLRAVHDWVFPSYRHELERVVWGSESILDVGCGKGSPIKHFSFDLRAVGVDVFLPALEESKKLGLHDEYHHMNVLEIGEKFSPDSFDCVLASDLIEHLEKRDGLKLIDMMEKIARKKIIIFTPRDFLHQGEYEENPWQIHKSGWGVEEMQQKGYEVVGIGGQKWVWRIEWLWKKRDDAPLFVRLIRKILVDLTQLIARWYPKSAFQILCVKTKHT